jgi:hypothetical protein
MRQHHLADITAIMTGRGVTSEKEIARHRAAWARARRNHRDRGARKRMADPLNGMG